MIRLAVRCRAEQAGPVLAELLVLAPGGVEEEEGEGFVEYAIYGAPGELPDLGRVEATAGDGLIEVTSTEVPDDWAERWADFHEPVLVADRVWVRPSWEPPAADGKIDVVIDPGQAFGTGAHPTTRLCIELLVELAAAGEASGPIADWGTGSGVLAISAAKLGWGPVSGCDQEPAALEAARANAAANGVGLKPQRVHLRKEAPPPTPAAVANITAPILSEVARRFAAGEGQPPRLLVCSGMLANQTDQVAGAMAAAGLAEHARRTSGEWAALCCRR